MRRGPPRFTLDRSSAASGVYERQALLAEAHDDVVLELERVDPKPVLELGEEVARERGYIGAPLAERGDAQPVSYTHLRAHETVLALVCRLLLGKKKK